jgi:hypothetical protein
MKKIIAGRLARTSPVVSMSENTFKEFLADLATIKLPPWEEDIEPLAAGDRLNTVLSEVHALILPLHHMHHCYGGNTIEKVLALKGPLLRLGAEVTTWLDTCPYIETRGKIPPVFRWGRIDKQEKIVGRTTGITYEEIRQTVPLARSKDYPRYRAIDIITQLKALCEMFSGPLKSVMKRKTSASGDHILIASLTL